MTFIAILEFFLIVSLIHLNRGLYFRSLLLEVQLRTITRRFRKRMRFTENFRRVWVWACRLIPNVWKPVCILMKPATVLDWQNRRYKGYWTFISNQSKPSGRPPEPLWVRKLIVRLAKENPLWDASRIAGAIKNLHGYEVHRDTVRKYMPGSGPDPRKTIGWRTFLKLNMPGTVAMDFFLIKRRNIEPLLGLVMLHHGTRKILHFNLCVSPTSEWVKQQFLLVFSDLKGISYVLCDNDPLFSGLDSFAKDLFGLTIVRTQPRSPYQNPYVERVIRTIREDLLYFIFKKSKQLILQRLLEYKEYYNNHRPHTSLDLRTPANTENICPGQDYRLVSTPVLGGLHHTYHWKKVA